MATRSRDIRLVDSLTSYVNDVKPYHTKLQSFTSEVSLTDTLNVSFIDESLSANIYMQNVWTKSDIGCTGLTAVSNGADADRYIDIPATIFPRFSATTHKVQAPLGTDPAVPGLVPVDGVPDAYADLGWSYSHQLGSDVVPYELIVRHVTASNLTWVELGDAYQVTAGIEMQVTSNVDLYGITTSVAMCSMPKHGNSFTLDRVSSTDWFCADRVLTIPKSALPSLFGSAPLALQLKQYIEAQPVSLTITANTGRYSLPFNNGTQVYVDGALKKLGVDYTVSYPFTAIQFLAGKHPASAAKLTINYFNCDRLFIAQADPFAYNRAVTSGATSDTFTLLVDRTVADNYTCVFTNLDTGSTKPQLAEVLIYPSQDTGCVWEITATSYLTVKVQQVAPIVGPLEYASMGKRFDNAKISFLLKAPWTSYYFEPDADSYAVYAAQGIDKSPYGVPTDPADCWVNLGLSTEHGALSSTGAQLVSPVQLVKIGTVQQKQVTTSQGTATSYQLVLDAIPARGSYTEVRVEQAKQYNPRVNASILERFTLVEQLNFIDSITTNPVRYFGQRGVQLAHNTTYTGSQLLGSIPLGDVGTVQYPRSSKVSWPRLSVVNLLPIVVGTGSFVNVNYSIGAFDLKLFDTLPPQGKLVNNAYALIKEDVYFSITKDAALGDETYDAFPYDDAGYGTRYQTLTYHHVDLHPEANFYQEPKEVDVLTLHHQLPGITGVKLYYNGEELTTSVLADLEVSVEPEQVRIVLPEPMSIAVLLLQ